MSEARAVSQDAMHEANGKLFTGVPWHLRLTTLFLIGSDIVMVLASYILAAWLYSHPLASEIRYRLTWDPTAFLVFGAIMSIVMVVILGAVGLYSKGAGILNVEEDVMILKGIIAHALIAIAVSFAIRDYPIPRFALLFCFIFMAVLIILGRHTVRGIGMWFAATGIGSQPVVIYGAGDTGKQLATRIIENPQFGLTVAGFIDDIKLASDKEIAFGPGNSFRLPILGNGEKLSATMKDGKATNLFLAMPKLSTERLLEIQEDCREQGYSCYYVPLFSTGPFRRLNMTFIGDIPLITERAVTQNFYRRYTKRLLDIVLAIFGLIITSPILLFAAIGIRLCSKGPIIFKQIRIGINGKPFEFYKFRSMHIDAAAYASKHESDKHKIFTFGKILRRSSIDELPQLINVLKGEMSLVGPRPDMPQIVEHYDHIQKERLMVLPGMTGLWQISADRNFPIHENIDYDLYYIYNQSFLLDVVLIIRTLFCLFNGH